MIWFCGLAALAYVHRLAIAVPAKEIEEQLDISREDMGFILGIFFWGYATMQIPSGWIAGRFGSRLVVPILVLLWSVANGLMALGVGFAFLLSVRFFMGMAQAGLFPCAVQSFARWFPPSRRALPNGYLTAFMSVGGVAAGVMTGFLLGFLDWQTLMFIYSVPGVGCAIRFYLWYRERPEEHPSVNAAELAIIREERNGPSAHADDTDIRAWWTPFLSFALVLVCLQQFCRAAAYIFYATWWPTFLREARGLDVETAGYLSTLPLVGVAVGGILGGELADEVYRRTGSLNWSRRGVAFISLLAAGLLMLLGYLTGDIVFTIFFLTLSSFFAGVCGTASYTFTIDLGGKQVATVFSVMNMAGNIGAAILPSVVVPIQEEYGWDSVLLLIAGLYAAAALCWILVRIPRGQTTTTF